MTQNVLDYSQNPSGAELMDDYLAGMAENQLTNHSGVSRPSYAKAGTFWIDTSVTPWVLKQFTGTNDLIFGTLDQSNLVFTAERVKNGVYTTGNQTIGGIKTHTDTLYVSNSGESSFISKKTNMTKGTAPTDTQIQGYYCYDSSGKPMARFRQTYKSNKENCIELYTYKANAESDTATALISLIYPATGNPYATCPTPDMTTSTASTRMVNAGWANSLGNNIMHLTGDEEASGNKKFTGQLISKRANNDARIVNNLYNYTKGTSPSSNQQGGTRILDKNGTEIADIDQYISTSGSNIIRLRAFDPGTGTSSAVIQLTYPANGTPYTEVPTPSSATDNSKKIANTEWIHNHLSNSGVKATLGGLAIPDYTTASETGLGNITSGHRFTPTQDGTLHVQVQGTYVEVHISLVRTNDTLELVGAKDSDSGVAAKTVWIPVKAGQTYEITGRGSTRFYAFFCSLTASS